MLSMGARSRLLGALVIIALLWLAVAWAMH